VTLTWMRNRALSLRPTRGTGEHPGGPEPGHQREEANEKKQHTRDLLTAHARVLCASDLLGINFAVSYCVKGVGDARYRTFSATTMLGAIPDSVHHLQVCNLRSEVGRSIRHGRRPLFHTPGC
jgi:hypothetical protein